MATAREQNLTSRASDLKMVIEHSLLDDLVKSFSNKFLGLVTQQISRCRFMDSSPIISWPSGSPRKTQKTAQLESDDDDTYD